MNVQKKQIRWLLGIGMAGVMSFGLLYLMGYQQAVWEREEIVHQIQKLESERSYFLANQGSLDRLLQQVDSLSRRLKEVEEHFISLREFPRALQETAGLAFPLRLRVMGADPQLQRFEATRTDSSRVHPLYLEWRVRGSYFQIGKFIQDWNKLPFEQLPVGIELQRLQRPPFLLEARITSKVFIVNTKGVENDQES